MYNGVIYCLTRKKPKETQIKAHPLEVFVDERTRCVFLLLISHEYSTFPDATVIKLINCMSPCRVFCFGTERHLTYFGPNPCSKHL